MNGVHRFLDEVWQVVYVLLYPGGSPLEGGSQLEDGQLDLLGDPALFGLSWLILKVFCSSVSLSSQPPVNCLSSCFKIVGDFFDRQPFLNELSKCSSDVG